MTIGDLKIGMYLKDIGPGNIPLYDNPNGTGNIPLTIHPGETVGQIVDFGTGPSGSTVILTSQAIFDTGTLPEKFEDWLLDLVPGIKNSACLAANFTDIAANCSDAQIADQNNAIANAGANGATLKNLVNKTITDIASGAGGALNAAAQGFGVGNLLLYGGVAALIFLMLKGNIKTKGFSYSTRGANRKYKFLG